MGVRVWMFPSLKFRFQVARVSDLLQGLRDRLFRDSKISQLRRGVKDFSL